MYIAGDDELLLIGVPETVESIADISEKTALDGAWSCFGAFGDGLVRNAMKGYAAELLKVFQGWFLAEPGFVRRGAVRCRFGRETVSNLISGV